jgi:hypothetical protein
VKVRRHPPTMTNLYEMTLSRHLGSLASGMI